MIKTLSIFIICGILLAGCGKCYEAQETGDTRVVAKINDYQLTVDDFKNETDITLARRYLSGDPRGVREAVLEDLIIKKVLLQEAQKQDFDKDKKFMKEIERYWEQALLKLLIQKKTSELKEAGMSDDEAREALEEWIDNLREQSSITINGKVLDTIEIGNKE